MYPNTLKVIRISGREIREALEKTAEYFEVNAHGNIAVNESFLKPKPQHFNYEMWRALTIN
ncbi:hypothetical protein [Paenibacillus sinopodophylli]|uniref:hypothetical protein n=1 Tax=Paenibacillus sinopodophylli TaxID=1837342 RepID=UPI00110CF25E|nr:hypothetical protein [Paenibacillus sinopodophylli]